MCCQPPVTGGKGAGHRGSKKWQGDKPTARTLRAEGAIPSQGHLGQQSGNREDNQHASSTSAETDAQGGSNEDTSTYRRPYVALPPPLSSQQVAHSHPILRKRLTPRAALKKVSPLVCNLANHRPKRTGPQPDARSTYRGQQWMDCGRQWVAMGCEGCNEIHRYGMEGGRKQWSRRTP